MACYHPIPALQQHPGEKPTLWARPEVANLTLPCGNCIGCKTEHALGWARRSQYEASAWDHNCFVTLTYDDDHLPHRGYLVASHLQKFIKRLREAHRKGRAPAIRSTPAGPRYLACGEYGETTGRPHYHLLLFNCAFADQVLHAKDLYESPTLSKLWRKGNHKIGALTGASANYVAQYTLKKIGWQKDLDGLPPHDDEGEVIQPPFLRASLKPPIGESWTRKHYLDLQHGYLVVNGRKEKIPRALKRQMKKIDPALAEEADFKASQHPKRKDNLQAAELIHAQRAAHTQQRRAI